MQDAAETVSLQAPAEPAEEAVSCVIYATPCAVLAHTCRCNPSAPPPPHTKQARTEAAAHAVLEAAKKLHSLLQVQPCAVLNHTCRCNMLCNCFQTGANGGCCPCCP
jgi:hypothetical protein